MLNAGGRSLLRHSIEGFSAHFEDTPFLFIFREIHDTATFLRTEVETMGIADVRFVCLARETRGQAETVALGLQNAAVPRAESVTIFNIDSIRTRFTQPSTGEIGACDGWLEVFRGTGDNWSFVESVSPNSTRVARVTEKDPISDLCSTGLYHFARSGDFLDAFHAELEDGPSQAGELYVAPLYNRLIMDGYDIRYRLIDVEDVIFAGIPQEYEELKKRYD